MHRVQLGGTVAAGYERYEDDRYNSNAEGIHHYIPSSGDVCPSVWSRDGYDGKYSILVPVTLYRERRFHAPSHVSSLGGRGCRDGREVRSFGGKSDVTICSRSTPLGGEWVCVCTKFVTFCLSSLTWAHCPRLRSAGRVDFRAANDNLRGGFPLWTTATRLGFSYRLLWCC